MPPRYERRSTCDMYTKSTTQDIQLIHPRCRKLLADKLLVCIQSIKYFHVPRQGTKKRRMANIQMSFRSVPIKRLTHKYSGCALFLQRNRKLPNYPCIRETDDAFHCCLVFQHIVRQAFQLAV
uniref:Uncharacterized protein n=1 Tax=Anguilla anguilla TaxID=7936 RepID=A0A0E9WGF3_ANGAN